MAEQFERDPHLRGRKSGRVAPRVHHRLPARESTLVNHGLMEYGDADPRQGQLFDTTPYTVDADVDAAARRAGVAPPLPSSRGGFLPGIEGTKTKSAGKRKVEAIQKYAEMRRDNPVDAPEGVGEIAATMHHVQSLRDDAGGHRDWYSKRDARGHVIEGESTAQIREAAARTGIGMTEMTRAVAQMSPQMPWSDGNPLDRSYPNIESTEAVAHKVREAEIEAAKTGGSPKLSHEELGAIGKTAEGQGLSLSKERAAVSIGDPSTSTQPLPGAQNYRKVQNFNESLNFSRPELPSTVRQAYAGSYTQDLWDMQAHNVPDNLHDRVGQYEISHMIGSRAAFKRGELPADYQAAVWEHVRDPDPLTTSYDAGGGRYKKSKSLFREEPDGTLSPQFDFSRPSGKPQDNRSAKARDFDLPF